MMADKMVEMLEDSWADKTAGKMGSLWVDMKELSTVAWMDK